MWSKSLSGAVITLWLVSVSAWAQDMSAWSDQTVCRLVASQSNNQIYVDEALSRGLACARQASSGDVTIPSQQLLKGDGIRVYPVVLAAKEQQRLLSQAIDKTVFDFSAFDMATFVSPLTCEFRLRRVVYETSKDGVVENWNMARGQLAFTNDGVKVDGNWRMRGLSRDSSYLKNEVNLGLTKSGHLVGKMAYFHLMVDAGEVPEKPLYVELIPHQRSQPLNLAKPKKAVFWIDVEDWAGGVLRIWNCQFN